MISGETEARLLRLLALQQTYLPNADVAAQIAGKTLICFVGASCMGKNTIMDGLDELDAQYGIAHTITSRVPRTTDEPGRYTYYEHSDQGLATLLGRIENREILQYAIIPGSLSVRTSEALDYPYRYNLGDILSIAIPTYRQLGFGRLDILSIISEPEGWQRRFNERFPLGHPDRNARLDEAIISLTWSLEQPPASTTWIINHEGNPQAAIGAANQAIMHNVMSNQSEARNMAEACLSLIRKLAS
jgi:guanylate kinase